MKPLRGVVWAGALGLLATQASPVRAAWCNVFQVCCHKPGRVSASLYLPDPCCNPCPQPVCTTNYVQRAYYQPVTTYQTRTYYEPVTTYRTSYYYEPVVSYRYSCYFDPCTCRYQQVAVPTTSYQLRSQCCPVQSWVQRCCSVPVTTYQQAYYWEPVTTCCTPTSLPSPCPPNGQPAPVSPAPPPAVSEQRPVPSPGVSESPGSGGNGTGSPLLDRTYPPPPDAMPRSDGNSYRQALPRLSAPLLSPPAAPPPTVKLDRIVAAPRGSLEGKVVRADNLPQAGARLLFVRADRQEAQQLVTADSSGQFRVALASGGWLVYVNGRDGKPVFHSKIEVRDSETRQLTLVSR